VAASVGPRPPIVVGLGLMAVAIYLISTVSLETSYSELWLPTSMMGFGVGFALTPMNLAAMNAISRDHAGAAAGLLVTLSGLGATLGVAVTGALFQELNTERTISNSEDAGVTISRSQAQELDGLLAGAKDAHQTLEQIAGRSADQVQHAVREAFVSALGTSLKISAALVVLGLLLTVLLMRRLPPVDPEEPTGAAEAAPVVAPPTPRPAPHRTFAWLRWRSLRERDG
jgi:predicted MFS family arabinose efflux permease